MNWIHRPITQSRQFGEIKLNQLHLPKQFLQHEQWNEPHEISFFPWEAIAFPLHKIASFRFIGMPRIPTSDSIEPLFLRVPNEASMKAMICGIRLCESPLLKVKNERGYDSESGRITFWTKKRTVAKRIHLSSNLIKCMPTVSPWRPDQILRLATINSILHILITFSATLVPVIPFYFLRQSESVATPEFADRIPSASE